MIGTKKHHDRRSRLGRLLGTEDGVSAVELALIAPFLAMVILGVADYGKVYGRATTLANAARVGTQYAMIFRPNDDSSAEMANTLQATRDALPADFDFGNAANSVTARMLCECPPVNSGFGTCTAKTTECGTPAWYVQVEITEEYSTMFDYKVIPDKVTLFKDSVMRLR